MNKRARIILFSLLGVILLGIGLFATFALYNQIQQTANKASQSENENKDKITVVITTHDMKLGDLIRESDITTLTMPSEYAPRDTLSKVEDALDKFIKADMVQGEMVLRHNLADPTNINHDIAYILSDDHVLLAFPAEDLMSSSAIIQRGDIVDILATLNLEVGNIGGPITTETNPSPVATAIPPEEEIQNRTLTMDAYQAVEITALVADIITKQDSSGNQTTETAVRSYLLALPPQDALLLKHLIDTGARFDMVIRAPTSRAKFDLIPVTKDYIVELYGLGIIP